MMTARGAGAVCAHPVTGLTAILDETYTRDGARCGSCGSRVEDPSAAAALPHMEHTCSVSPLPCPACSRRTRGGLGSRMRRDLRMGFMRERRVGAGSISGRSRARGTHAEARG